MDTGERSDGLRHLVLLRHGRSTGYQEDAFSGWLDVPLSEEGEREARRAGALMSAAGLAPSVVHTSCLSRAVATADLVLCALGRPQVPVIRSWRLNERHYGALQGRPRAAVRAEVGDELFDLWRRSYEHAPPPAADTPGRRPRTAGGVPEPRTESLADVRRRLEPYWHDVLLGDLKAAGTVLVVGHSNSLRALCMVLDDLSTTEVTGLNLPTGVPLRYDFDGRDVEADPSRPRPLRRGGTWLDPAAAATGAAEVRAQGRGHTPTRTTSPHRPGRGTSPMEEPA